MAGLPGESQLFKAGFGNLFVIFFFFFFIVLVNQDITGYNPQLYIHIIK